MCLKSPISNGRESFLHNFLKHPFETLDQTNLVIGRFQFNVLKDDEAFRKAFFTPFFLIPLLAWLFLGTDSTLDQAAWLLWHSPEFLLGRINFTQWISVYNQYYGLGTHWSASVIYMGLLIGVSKHLHDKLDIKNSLNLALTCGFVGLSIGSFEFFWDVCFYVFQNQHWILTLQFPQGGIILRNLLFSIVGLVVLGGMNYKEYSLGFGRRTIVLILITVGLAVLWIGYGLWFPVQPLTVGIWTSTNLFPQTLYTVQTDSSVMAGTMFYVPNEAVHLLNNLTKIFWSLTFYSLAQIKIKGGMKNA